MVNFGVFVLANVSATLSLLGRHTKFTLLYVYQGKLLTFLIGPIFAAVLNFKYSCDQQ